MAMTTNTNSTSSSNNNAHDDDTSSTSNHHYKDEKVQVLLYCNPLERSTWVRTGLVLLLAFVGTLGITYYTIGPGRHSDTDNTNPQGIITMEQMEYYQRRFVTIRPILLQYTDLSDFIVPMSPQSKALEWILYKDNLIQLQETNVVMKATTIGSNTTVTATYTLDAMNLHRLKQRYAVMVLYYALNGDSWQRSSSSSSSNSGSNVDSNGLPIQTIVPVLQLNDSSSIPSLIQIQGYDTYTDQSECTMDGILCDDDDDPTSMNHGTANITSINLQGFGATGKIPSELGLLTMLSSLNLASNIIDGTIPGSIFTKLTNLEIIKLDQNEISSTIPSTVGMLTKLKNFSIGYNLLSGNLTSAFGMITTLELLNIENNVNITGYNIFDMILQNKTKLKHIHFDSTQLSGTIPLNLSYQVPSLRTFTMEDTLLTGPMPDLNSLQYLRRLIIVNDDIYGPIPELRSLTNLEYVHFQGGNINGTISSYGIHKLHHLRELRVISTNVNGSIPTDIGMVSSLVNLIIFDNRFLTGTIPSDVGNLPNLRKIEIYENDNNGTFPNGLCDKKQISVKRPCNVMSSKCNSICI